MRKTKLIIAGLSAGVLCAISASGSSAATATANMTVTAAVQATCIMSAGTLAFGNYTGAQVDGSTTLSVTCTDTTDYTVSLDEGTYSGATTATRRLTGSVSGSSLGYQLYSNAGRTTAWGNDTGTDTVDGTGNGTAQTLNVYGRITSGQYPAPGSYSDTVVATLTY
jgi:spore coat protein U-like protein